MVTITKTIDGVEYITIPETHCCDGCVANPDGDCNFDLCFDLENSVNCYDHKIIWAKKQPDFKDQLLGVSADMINPDHYKVGGMETIDYLKAKLSPEEYKGYLKGNALKYLSRSNFKHEDPTEDYKKALWYVTKLTESP